MKLALYSSLAVRCSDSVKVSDRQDCKMGWQSAEGAAGLLDAKRAHDLVSDRAHDHVAKTHTIALYAILSACLYADIGLRLLTPWRATVQAVDCVLDHKRNRACLWVANNP